MRYGHQNETLPPSPSDSSPIEGEESGREGVDGLFLLTLTPVSSTGQASDFPTKVRDRLSPTEGEEGGREGLQLDFFQTGGDRKMGSS
jgi:hypothetical protein